MAEARQVSIGEVLKQVNYELRNTGAQYAPEEMTGYLNRSMELLYHVLCTEESPLLRKGQGSLQLAADAYEYDLSGADMGDLWFVHRAWIPGSDPMDLCDEDDKYTYLRDYETGVHYGDSEPVSYYLVGDSTIGFLPFPDAGYQVNVVYYPNYVPIDSQAAPMPYRNMFNQELIEVTKMFAKNRESTPLGIDAAMMELFQLRALELSRKRVKREMAITIRRRE
jgi:hypothetical protein